MNNYKKGAKIGWGKQGDVYQVYETTKSGKLREKAMKSIIVRSIEEANTAMGELNTVMQCRHTNMVQYEKIFLHEEHRTIVNRDGEKETETTEYICMIMPYYENRDLDAYIKSKKEQILPEQTIVDMMKQLAGFLKYFHEQKLIHRDLKPQNILVEENKETGKIVLKVGDFGLSTTYSADSMRSSVVGSLYYLAPEVMRGSYTEKIDCFSLGCICIYLLCGMEGPMYMDVLPHLRTKTLQTIQRRITQTPYKITYWMKLIEHLLQIEPNDRYSAAQTEKALEQFPTYFDPPPNIKEKMKTVKPALKRKTLNTTIPTKVAKKSKVNTTKSKVKNTTKSKVNTAKSTTKVNTRAKINTITDLKYKEEKKEPFIQHFRKELNPMQQTLLQNKITASKKLMEQTRELSSIEEEKSIEKTTPEEKRSKKRKKKKK